MHPPDLSRREFLRIVISTASAAALTGCSATDPTGHLAVDLWVEVHADGRIRMLTKKVEMGQGAHTGLRTLLGEELDVVPESIEIVQVQSDAVYGELITGGSYTIAGSNQSIRMAGATARYLLLMAAADQWQVPVVELITHEARIEHLGGRHSGTYAEFVDRAARLPKPSRDAVKLKERSTWKYIGHRSQIAHHQSIATGDAKFGIDTRLPGMCYASLARAPTIGARLKRWNAAKAAEVPGFIGAVVLEGNTWPSRDHVRDSVAVFATNSWAAMRARALLEVHWESGKRDAHDSRTIDAILSDHAMRPGINSLRNSLEHPETLGQRRFEAQFNQNYVAHAPMEPPNATARFDRGRLEVWCGNQRQTRLKEAIAVASKLPLESIVVHATLIGGSFGRRLEIDYGLEAALLAIKLQRPVQILWTREDDIRLGLYKPGSAHRLNATLDLEGRITSFAHRFAAESVLKQQEPASLPVDGSDWTLATPLAAFFYEVPQLQMDYHAVPPMVPCAWWRGTYSNNVTAAVETFMDELAELTHQDPLEFRLKHLSSDGPRKLIVDASYALSFDPARMRAVLAAAAEEANWRRPAAEGIERGLACGTYNSPESHVAVIVEMALDGEFPKLLRAVVAVDVGVVVNPEIVEAQALGGFLMGASLALREQITFLNNEVVQHNFMDYPLPRMHDCPRIDVRIMEGHTEMCGVGELVTPASAAAVANACSRSLQKRVRSLPVFGTQQ